MHNLNKQKQALDDSAVLDYLIDYPEFFKKKPELLEQIKIPHADKGTISLIEYQLEKQRHRIAQLEKELDELIAIASDNERIFNIYGDLYGDLHDCETLAEINDLLNNTFLRRLHLTGLTLWLKPSLLPATALGDHHQGDDKLFDSLLNQQLRQRTHYFGRLDPSTTHSLFGYDCLVNSVALMSINNMGVIAFASSTPNHFTPHHGTLLLDQLNRQLQKHIARLAASKSASDDD